MLADDPLAGRRKFDAEAQMRMEHLLGRCPPGEFLRELIRYAPTSRREEFTYEKLRGWAEFDLGNHRSARVHLLRALRRSTPRSAERALARGLLAETYLCTGYMEHTERLVHRALSQLPADDPGNYLHTGFMLVLGRLYRRQGHLSHAIDTFHRGLSLVSPDSAHWSVLVANTAHALVLRGRYHEAMAFLEEHASAAPDARLRNGEWGAAAALAAVALSLGQLVRAEELLDTTLAHCAGTLDDRGRLALALQRADLERARRDWEAAERIDRGVLAECERHGRNGDMLSTAANGLAETLVASGRPGEALAAARMGVLAGSDEDYYEWARGLHVLGLALCALGHRGEARDAFQEAIGLHERMQFDAECARLVTSLARHGYSDLVRTPPAFAALATMVPLRPEPLRAPLADGREFVTTRRDLLESIHAAARSGLPVLIEGETGTGKELVARLLHERGSLAYAPFVVVDCATLPIERADAELFGAVRGAGTGSNRDRPGRIAEAHGGTLFLDELPALAPALQARLLRVLQEGTYRRLGEDRSRRSRFRVIAATQRGVEGLLKSGALRPDLYFRLNGHRITLEPLRARPDDLEALAHDILRRCGVEGVSAAALRRLREHPWPGNVRQLEMVLRVAACRCPPCEPLEVRHLDLGPAVGPPPPSVDESLRGSRLAGERAMLLKALADHDEVVTRAARSLGLTRQAFYKAMRRTGLKRNGSPGVLGADPKPSPSSGDGTQPAGPVA